MKNNFVLKIFAVLCLGMIIFTSFCNVYAANNLVTNTQKNKGTSFLNKIFGQGSDFFDPSNVSSGNNEIGGKINKEIKDLGIIGAVLKVGNLLFIVITSVLGVKYIFAGSAAKADIKNSLITLCFAVVFFFLAEVVYDFANGSLSTLFGGNVTYTSVEGKIWSTFRIVINLCAILGIVLIGLRYMMASANTRADIKTELIPVVVGIILVYATINIINFIIEVSNTALT